MDLLFSSSKHIENSIQRGEPSVHQGESAAKQEEQQQEEFQAHVAYWDPFIPDIVAPAQQIAKNRMLGKSSEEVHTIVRLMEKVVSAKVRNQLAADAAADPAPSAAAAAPSAAAAAAVAAPSAAVDTASSAAVWIEQVSLVMVHQLKAYREVLNAASSVLEDFAARGSATDILMEQLRQRMRRPPVISDAPTALTTCEKQLLEKLQSLQPGTAAWDGTLQLLEFWHDAFGITPAAGAYLNSLQLTEDQHFF